MNKLVVIPSATYIPPELQADFGRIPSCMIPYGGAPALQRIAEGYDHEVRLVVASHANSDWIAKFLSHAGEERISEVNVGPTSSLGETVFRTLEDLGGWPGPLVVHLGDTLAQGQLLQGDAFLYACPSDLFRWTTFLQKPGGGIESIQDKGIEKSGPGRVFVGVFSFSDGGRFQDCLGEALRSQEGNLDPFYQAILTYYSKAEVPPESVEAPDWVDLGHLDTYYAARIRNAMGQRSFNAVSVDATRGILTKRSKHESKFLDEIQWYLGLPPDLQYLAPRVFSHSLSPGDMWIRMEYYGYPPLADIYLFSRLDLSEWNAIFQGIHRVLEDLRSHGLSAESAGKRGESLRSMYLDKTLERLSFLQFDQMNPELLDDRLRVNGRPCISLKTCIAMLPHALEAAELLSETSFNVIHGDFCLSNILFDRRSQAIRLVDPRGRFGAFQSHGDPRYDLAKLSHCFNGGYDFLIQGLFSLKSDGAGNFDFRVFMDDRHRAVSDQFNQYFLASPILSRQVRGIEALLFLSMVPLHADRPLAQEAFLLRGLELATEFLSNHVGSTD